MRSMWQLSLKAQLWRYRYACAGRPECAPGLWTAATANHIFVRTIATAWSLFMPYKSALKLLCASPFPFIFLQLMEGHHIDWIPVFYSVANIQYIGQAQYSIKKYTFESLCRFSFSTPCFTFQLHTEHHLFFFFLAKSLITIINQKNALR